MIDFIVILAENLVYLFLPLHWNLVLKTLLSTLPRNIFNRSNLAHLKKMYDFSASGKSQYSPPSSSPVRIVRRQNGDGKEYFVRG